MYLIRENSAISENPLFVNLSSIKSNLFEDNKNVFISSDVEVAKEIFQKGFSNKGLIKWCMDNFMKPTHVFLDINAGFGEFTIHLSKNMKKTYAFENNPKKYACLVNNVALHDLSEKVITLPFKLSSETKPTTSSIYKLDDLNFLEENIGFIRSPGLKAILEGAKNTIIKNKLPPILFNIDETNIAAVASKKDLFEYLESLKYKIVVINGIKDTFLAIKSE